MRQEAIEAIKGSPTYRELVSKRKRFAWTLTTLMLLIYYGFILTVAFWPKSLATPLAPGYVITVGIPIGVVIIISAFVLTGIYVWRANGEFDSLTKAIREEQL